MLAHCNSQGSAPAEAQSPEHNPSLPLGRQEVTHLSLCLPRSALAGSWNQELESGIKPWHSGMGEVILTGIGTARLNAHPTSKNTNFAYEGLVTPRVPHLLMPPHWRLGFSVTFEGMQTFTPLQEIL